MNKPEHMDIDQDLDIRPMQGDDFAAVSALHAQTFGPGRFARAAYRVREGHGVCSRHCTAAWRGADLAGSVTLTGITVGTARGHWLLGPLAVRAQETNKGLGRFLVLQALQSITEHEGPDATIILVGDLPYYGRLGFEVVPRGKIRMPGPVDPGRLLIWRGPDASRAVPGGDVRAAKS